MHHCWFVFLFTFFDEQPDKKVEGITDKLFDVTEDVNSFLNANQNYTRLLIAISSFSIDVAVLSTFYLWLRYSKSFRFVVSLASFYITRSLLHVTFSTSLISFDRESVCCNIHKVIFG
eukprot:TRINITY_DN15547_c0_g1_i1.p1 TRINITY_DN15547_c0_g1~~TRINITY_DN15547_c0_g1_i1.p1  ORF type:complete len:118 (-),score=10.84 TRINITY_DN15547_c0_g1_i1:323-676(-)